jgi:DNA-directed RNA polymerase specialized sigma24 family protein
MDARTAGAFGEFPRTTSIWGLVEQVRAGTGRREALQALLLQYRAPLKAHLVVRKKLSSDAADDLLQSFIESKILRLKLIERADRAKGRFRSFLLTALDRYLIDEFRKPGEPVQALGETPVEAAVPDESEPFDVAWARQVIDAAVARMQDECQKAKRPDIWGVFDERMLKPILHGTEPASYEALVAKFDLATPSQASNVLMTAKRMFRRAMEAVVAEYEEGDREVEVEMESLRAILGKAGAG